MQPRSDRHDLDAGGRSGAVNLAPAPNWYRDALCREYPDLDFVDAELDKQTKREALQVCGRCLAMAECRAYAIDDAELVGIWGGTDTAARRAIRRLQRKTTTT